MFALLSQVANHQLLISMYAHCLICQCRHNAAAEDQAGTALNALQQLLGLSKLLQAAISGAQAKAAQLSASMPEEARYHGTAGPSWLSAENVKAAWLHIAEVG